MKNELLSARNGKRYLIAITAVSVINIALMSFLLHTSFGQATDKFTDQQPLKIEVAVQDICPLKITLVDVDNSDSSFQKINYAVQNVSGKPITGYVIWESGKSTGKVATNFFPIKPFQASVIYTGESFVERENIKDDENVSLSVDYVEFADGSSWGNDTQGQSKHIAGGRAGVNAAAEQLSDLIGKGEVGVLTALLKRDLVDIEVPLSGTAQNDKWQYGFRSGYKSAVSFLNKHWGKEDKEILEKLNEVRKYVQIKRGQEQ